MVREICKTSTKLFLEKGNSHLDSSVQEEHLSTVHSNKLDIFKFLSQTANNRETDSNFDQSLLSLKKTFSLIKNDESN